jgi:hypothetical protein
MNGTASGSNGLGANAASSKAGRTASSSATASLPVAAPGIYPSDSVRVSVQLPAWHENEGASDTEDGSATDTRSYLPSRRWPPRASA